MKNFKTILAVWTVISTIATAGCSDSAPGFVDDRMEMLSGAQRRHIEEFHQALWSDLGIYFHLAILDEPAEDILQAAVDMYDRELVLKRNAGERGLLLLIDTAGQKVRLEVGYGLEPIFPDGFVGYVERDQMAPFFADDRVNDGVEATVELLVSRAYGKIDPDTVSASPAMRGSGGGGAEGGISIGGGIEHSPSAEFPGRFLPKKTPMASLQVYMQVLTDGIADPDLEIYTDGTRSLLSQWLVTAAQQKNELEGIVRYIPSAKTHISGGLAVIRFPVDARTQPPYFFRKSDAGWQLDLASMHRLIRFNHLNQWHFTESDHEFLFAFSDGRIDRNGYVY